MRRLIRARRDSLPGLLARTELALRASGIPQKQAGADDLSAATHLVVEHLWLPRLEHRPAAAPSRDFH